MWKYTFKQFQAEYPDDAACLAKLMEVNYGGTEIVCPGCGVEGQISSDEQAEGLRLPRVRPSHLSVRRDDLSQVAARTLTKWFFAMYLMTSTRHGVAAKEIERQFGVTYKTAWRMAHELRKLMASADYGGQLCPVTLRLTRRDCRRQQKGRRAARKGQRTRR